MYFAQMLSCPQCGMPIEIRLGNISSGLGPDKITCFKCGHPIGTRRLEWPEMPVSTKVWYFFVTLVYIAVCGLLTGNFFDQTYQLWNRDPIIVNLRYQALPFQASACFGGLIAAILQLYRIPISYRRSRTEHPLTLQEFFLGLQWNLQFKFLTILILIWLIAKIRYSL
ncbi:MAG: hypothetical protein V4719_01345 [Planctomycetota bacterium]